MKIVFERYGETIYLMTPAKNIYRFVCIEEEDKDVIERIEI